MSKAQLSEVESPARALASLKNDHFTVHTLSDPDHIASLQFDKTVRNLIEVQFPDSSSDVDIGEY